VGRVKTEAGLGVVAHACNPIYKKGIGRSPRLAPVKKHETLSEKYLKQIRLQVWLKW
jgi:hypothetical protein